MKQLMRTLLLFTSLSPLSCQQHTQVQNGHRHAATAGGDGPAGEVGIGSTVRFLAPLTLTAVLVAGASVPARAQQLTMNGSSGMVPLARALVQAFEARNGSAPFEVGRGSSSGSAHRAVAADRLDVGLSSKPLGDAERTAGLHSVEIARTATVFAVHASVKISGLTTQQVCGIYAGTITNWQAVGGPDLAILPLTRPASETPAKIVRKHVPCFKEGKGVLSLLKAGHMAKALAAKAGAFGFTNLAFVQKSQGAIRALALNGTAPTPANLQSGVYPLVRRFFLITKGAPVGTVAEFVAFVKSADGDRVIRDTKAVPVQ
ncbi:MAG: substrate-binding domain-containing protein [Candidatus Methylomirabilales bacterium]